MPRIHSSTDFRNVLAWLYWPSRSLQVAKSRRIPSGDASANSGKMETCSAADDNSRSMVPSASVLESWASRAIDTKSPNSASYTAENIMRFRHSWINPGPTSSSSNKLTIVVSCSDGSPCPSLLRRIWDHSKSSKRQRFSGSWEPPGSNWDRRVWVSKDSGAPTMRSAS